MAQVKLPETENVLDDFLKILQVGRSIQSLIAPASGQTISASSTRSNILSDVDSYSQGIMNYDDYYDADGYNPSKFVDEASQVFNPVMERFPEFKSDILRRINIRAKGIPKQRAVQKRALRGDFADSRGRIENIIKSVDFSEDFFPNGKYNPDLLINDIKKDEAVKEEYKALGSVYRPSLDKFITSTARTMPKNVWLRNARVTEDIFEDNVRAYDTEIKTIKTSMKEMEQSKLEGSDDYQAQQGLLFKLIMGRKPFQDKLTEIRNRQSLLAGLGEGGFESLEDVLKKYETKQPKLSEKQQYILDNQ